MRNKSLIAILVCSTLAACGDGKSFSLKLRDFQKPVPSGLRKIAQARQMAELFGPAKHAVVNLRDDQVTAEWQTTVLFRGRYEMLMTVPVRMTDNFDEVKEVLGTPEFQLLEVSAITDEGYGAKYDPQGARHFSADDWAKIYRAKGDLSAAGISLKNQPVRDFEKYKKIVLPPNRDPAQPPLVGTLPTELKVTIDPNRVQIRGGSNEFFQYGSLSILRIVFSNPVHLEPGPSGNKDGNSGWREEESALQSGETKPVRIDWEYSARTQKLLFNGVTFDVPFDRMAVVNMHNGTPELKLQMKTEAAIQAQRLQLDRAERK
jgi:hypothetical protein